MTLTDFEQGYYTPPTEPPRRRSRRPLIVSLVVLGLVISATAFVAGNRQYLVDQWTVLTWDSNATVEAYADRATMTDHAEFLFTASTPTIAAAEAFNGVCENHEEGSGVLGCYMPDEKKITLFDVTDERLDGIEEVVASHEMLHAAWDRMGKDERADLGILLEAEAVKLSGDADFTARMDVYARTEPGERLNELHSIVGTEIAEISAELESYYARYFDDRAALVALHLKSNAVFEQLEAASAALVAELEALNTQMENDYARYQAGYDQLNADIERYNNKTFTSQAQANEEYNALISRQAELDALFASIQAMEVTWNEKHAQLEELNAQAAALNTSINIVPRSTG